MHAGTIEKIDIDLMCEMGRVNFEVTMALKYFKIANSGFLINVSSILGTKVRPSTGVYASTKFAIEAFSEAIRMEVAAVLVSLVGILPTLVDVLDLKVTELKHNFGSISLADLLFKDEALNREYVVSESWFQATVISKNAKLGIMLNPNPISPNF